MSEVTMATQAAEAVEPPETNDNQTRDFEAEAREIGWKPKEEWDGRGEWRDAEAFVKFRDDNLALKRKEADHLKVKISQLERQVRRLTKAEQAAFSAGMDQMKAQLFEAAKNGDKDAFAAIDRRMDEMRAEVTAEASGPQHGEDPSEQYDAFRDSNPWYDKGDLRSATETEIAARLFADRTAETMVRQGKQNELSPSAFFAEVARQTIEKFPTLKGPPPARSRPVADAVAGVPRAAPSKSARTGVNLPADAKAQADRFWSQGIYGPTTGENAVTKEQARDKYAKDFDWS